MTYGCHAERGGVARCGPEHQAVGLFATDEIDALPMPAGYRRAIRMWAEKGCSGAPR